MIKAINYIKEIIFIQDLITKKEHYIIAFCISLGFCIILSLLLLNHIIFANKKIKHGQIKVLNLMNLLLQTIFLFPIINIFVLSVKCKEKNIYI